MIDPRHAAAPSGEPLRADEVTPRATTSDRSLVDTTDNRHDHQQAGDVEARARGVRRLTLERETTGTCTTCGLRLDNPGAAWSHAATSRHTVEVRYATRFLFVGGAS